MNPEQDPDVVMEDELEYESDVEADLEVDELDSSGSDQENPVQPSVSTASKKAGSGKQGTRVPGHTLLPQTRIENILQAEGITGNLALSKEGQFILSVATEEFIKKFAAAGFNRAQNNRQKMVQYEDMAITVRRTRKFAFLKQTVPDPLPLETAWELRGIRHIELMEEDPALGGIIPPGSFGQLSMPPTPSPEPTPPIASTSTSTSSKKKGKQNGVDSKTNGHASASAVASSSRHPPAKDEPEIASISTAVQAQSKSASARGSSSRKNGKAAAVNGNGKQPGHASASATGFSTPSDVKSEVADADVMKVEDLSMEDDGDEEMAGGEAQPASELDAIPVIQAFSTVVGMAGWQHSSKMSASKISQLPIIDVAPFLTDDPAKAGERAAASAALHQACVEYGFFYLNIEAYVPQEEPEELARLGKEFFALPQEEKDKLALKNQDYARGYARLNENVTNGKADAHEGLDFYRPVENPDKTKPLWGENQWPSVPGFREKYEVWVDKMKKLGVILMKAMSSGLELTEEDQQELLSKVTDSFWVMRVIGYPPLPNDHDGVSCGAHKDYGCLTFLYADPTPSALQVFLRRPGASETDDTGLPREQGDEEGVWINADPIPGCVVCNIGEMWEIWTDGLYKSTLHRVVHRGSNFRVSIPFFFEPNFDALVRPLPSALRKKALETKKEQGEPERASIVYGDFLLAKVGNNFAVEGRDRYS